MQLALKLDVDTLRGYMEGVPRLLDLFASRGMKISMFFSFGPDNSGKAIRRIFRKGFISKMLRTRAPSTYGLKTMMYGTLLPAPMIAESSPEIFARACREGHDCGVHAWDHVYVQDELPRITKDEFADLFARAADLFESISGARPTSYAAPGWQENAASREALDELGLVYTSDSRGRAPFYPRVGGHASHTIDLPTTLPTMDEVYGADGANDETIPARWVDAMHDGLNVLTIHAEMEGLSKLGVLERTLDLAKERGAEFITLREAASTYRTGAPTCELSDGTLPGRAGTLALQGDEIKGAEMR